MTELRIQAGLAMLGLLLALWTYLGAGGGEEVAGGVRVHDCARLDVLSVTLDTQAASYSLSPAGQGAAPIIHLVRRTRGDPGPRAAADGGASDLASLSPHQGQWAHLAARYREQRFPGNAAAEAYLARVGRLWARRGLGVLSADRLPEFGLDRVGSVLHLRCGESQRSLQVGARRFGSAQTYVRDARTGEVYLISGAVVRDLRSARFKFMRTALLGFPFSQVDTVQVTARGRTRTLQRTSGGSGDLAWVPETRPEERNTLYGRWLSRVGELQALSYLMPGAAPGADMGNSAAPVEAVVDLAYLSSGRGLGRLSLVRVHGPGGFSYYAQSGYTRQWVRLYAEPAERVTRDVPLVVGVLSEPARVRSSAPAR